MVDFQPGNRVVRDPPLIIDISSAHDPDIVDLYLRQNCTRCPLAASRSSIVWGLGSPTQAKALVVGRHPNQIEDLEGIPLVGAPADLLVRLWQEVGLKQIDLYLSLLNRCYTSANRATTVEERVRCFPFLNRDISLMAPRLIVALGGSVFKSLTGITYRGGEEGLDLVGAQIRDKGRVWNAVIMGTYHPAAWLRMLPGDDKNTMFQRMISDWKLISSMISSYAPELNVL